MASKVKETSRLTHTPKTDSEKFVQDLWDKARNSQVKTFLKYNTQKAVLNFTAMIKRAIDDIDKRAPKERPVVAECYGSYERTDVNEKTEDFLHQFFLGIDERLLINKYAKDRGIVTGAIGRRKTGCLVFKNGRREPLDPTIGYTLDLGGDELDHITMVETFYVILLREAKDTVRYRDDGSIDMD